MLRVVVKYFVLSYCVKITYMHTLSGVRFGKASNLIKGIRLLISMRHMRLPDVQND